MRSLFTGLTPRGRAFVTAGAATGVAGLLLAQPALLSVGALLVMLPLLAVLAASRARLRFTSLRSVSPQRVPAGQTAAVAVDLINNSRTATKLLLAEDTVPLALGSRPRFVLDLIEPGGVRTLGYRVTPDRRGKFAVGPLTVRAADTFGLTRVASATEPVAILTVTPVIIPLSQTSLLGSWLGEGGSRASSAASAGEDDVVPRTYRDGDELRRVHWRSTARRGELMVRREEQRWRNRATLFLDTRRRAHSGDGPSSSFEAAVSAAASIGVELAKDGIDGEFCTDGGVVASAGSFEDALLDTLAVIQLSRALELTTGLGAIPRGDTGLLIAVAGDLTADQARALAAARRGRRPAMALLLDVASWASRTPDGPASRTQASAGVLRSAGWRVAILTAATPLREAWDALNLTAPPATAPPASALGGSR